MTKFAHQRTSAANKIKARVKQAEKWTSDTIHKTARKITGVDDVKLTLRAVRLFAVASAAAVVYGSFHLYKDIKSL